VLYAILTAKADAALSEIIYPAKREPSKEDATGHPTIDVTTKIGGQKRYKAIRKIQQGALGLMILFTLSPHLFSNLATFI